MKFLFFLFFAPVVFGGSLQFDLKRRSKSLNRRQDDDVSLVPKPENNEYCIELGFGSEKEKVQVIVDTGSSDLWVPISNATCNTGTSSESADCPKLRYKWYKSTTLKMSSLPFYVQYGDNSSAEGLFCQDTVWIGDTGINNTTFGLGAIVDSVGTMGLGFPQLEGSILAFNESSYPNFPQKLKMDGTIDRVIYSIVLNKDSSKSSLLFGAVDHEKYSGELLTIPMMTEEEYEKYMAISIDSIALASDKINQTLALETNVILDTGSTVSTFSNSVMQELAESLGGEVKDGQYYVDKTLADKSKLRFTFNNLTIETEVYIQDAGDGEYVLQYFNQPDDSIPANVLGQDVLTRIYAVYDLDGLEISIAPQSGSTKSNIEVVGADGEFNKASSNISETNDSSATTEGSYSSATSQTSGSSETSDSSQKSDASSIKNISVYLLALSLLISICFG